MSKPSIAMVGLAVMGSNLARNIESRGIPIAVFNRDTKVTERFMAQFGSGKFTPAHTLPELVEKMDRPRKIILLVKAGAAVDAVMEQLIPLLSPGDLIIDGGNSWFRDTQRREIHCRSKGLLFMGLGISGGEEGALNGPSLMPGGPEESWKLMQPVLEAIAARAEGEACTSFVGPDGAGHFVKMVHNGIEYADMQLIAEAYDLLRRDAKLSGAQLAETFAAWNKGVLESFLIEITAQIFRAKDPEGKGLLVDQILDKAGQKGTGAWTAQIALELGVPVPTLAAAVDARFLSAQKDERVHAASALGGVAGSAKGAPLSTSDIHDALYCAKIISYAQGMALLAKASTEFSWNLHLDRIAALWRGGCIIRARFLNTIRDAYRGNSALPNLMLDATLKGEIVRTAPALRKAVARGGEQGIPTLAFSTALAYLDSYRTASLPQNLTQAQRDFFGSHTYERTDKPGTFHSEWARLVV